MKIVKCTFCSVLLLLALSTVAFSKGGTISTTRTGTISTTRTGTISTTGTIPTTRNGIIPTTRAAVTGSQLSFTQRLGLLDAFITILQVW